MRSILCAAMLALTVTMAGAEENYSANYWLPHCKEVVEQRPIDEGLFGLAMFCAGLVQGVAVMALNAPEAGRCAKLPRYVSRQQLVRVVVRYIEARPQRMQEFFPSLVIEALHDAWPCK
jgi:Rap1a immunity proteins